MHLTCTNMPVEKLKEALAKVGAARGSCGWQVLLRCGGYCERDRRGGNWDSRQQRSSACYPAGTSRCRSPQPAARSPQAAAHAAALQCQWLLGAGCCLPCRPRSTASATSWRCAATRPRARTTLSRRVLAHTTNRCCCCCCAAAAVLLLLLPRLRVPLLFLLLPPRLLLRCCNSGALCLPARLTAPPA